MTHPDEITPRRPHRSPWYADLLIAANWVATILVATIGPEDLRPWACVASVLLALLAVGQRIALERLVDNLNGLVDAYREGARLDAEMVQAYRTETKRYRRAFAYAAAVRAGHEPLQAGLIAARDVEMPPTEDIE